MQEHSLKRSLDVCPICGGRQFATEPILWPELIREWQLAAHEADYIDLQQGLRCAKCRNNLRSMTLGAAVTNAFGFSGTFNDFCRTDPGFRQLIVIEVNAAGTLSPFLRLLPKHTQRSFPEIDLQRMKFETASIDVMIHSDTLEHVPDSRTALEESHRILKPGAHLFYTVPVVIGRLTRTRQGLPPSYHGSPGTRREDYTVQTEYGADFWCEIFEAGFRNMTVTSLIFPASMAISAIR